MDWFREPCSNRYKWSRLVCKWVQSKQWNQLSPPRLRIIYRSARQQNWFTSGKECGDSCVGWLRQWWKTGSMQAPTSAFCFIQKKNWKTWAFFLLPRYHWFLARLRVPSNQLPQTHSSFSRHGSKFWDSRSTAELWTQQDKFWLKKEPRAFSRGLA